MFSDQQFNEWISEAITIAKRHMTMVIGTSHADGVSRTVIFQFPSLIAYVLLATGWLKILLMKAQLDKLKGFTIIMYIMLFTEC